MRLAVIGLAALLLGAPGRAASAAQSGEDELLFTTHCALCHMAEPAAKGSPNEKAPTRGQLRQLPAEAVLDALSSGKMQLQGATLTDPQKRLVAEYVTGKHLDANAGAGQAAALCKFQRPMQDLTAVPGWNGHGNGPAATRFQDAKDAGMTAADLPRLKLKWAFGYQGVGAARTLPALAGGRLFIASENGWVRALDPSTGCTFWAFKAQAGVRSAPMVAEYKTQGRNAFVVVVR